MDPVAAYDQIAPQYAALAAQRQAYLDSIDRLVIAGIPEGRQSMLDVGAGDGTRSRRIAEICGIGQLVLLEPSVAMQKESAGIVWTIRAEDLHRKRGRFDVITCLWNVPGHIFPLAARAEMFRQFARLLSPQGRIFLDLSHRYNARHYGLWPTIGRFCYDLMSRDVTNGDVEVRWGQCVTQGHVFTQREVRSLCRSAGLAIEKTVAVDYATGEVRRRSFDGHLFYVLRRR